MGLDKCVFCECEVEEFYYGNSQDADNRFKGMNLCKDCQKKLIGGK